MECLPSGEWSREFSQCVPRSCGPPPPVDHAHPDTGHKLFGDTAIYFCDDGYTAGNNTKLFCNAEGIWAPPEGHSIPYCIATFCQRPPVLPHAILDSIYKPKYASNTEISYKCEEGFMLSTTGTLKCLMGGEWSPSPMDIGCVSSADQLYGDADFNFQQDWHLPTLNPLKNLWGIVKTKI
ncbi:sushi, von Willebrand factor type A, EGF and pentraxin domain-containing protein 1 isoform X2 [Silurus meridionalis]|nr:sushi, von Willebrand factor type A, EGF and pentraxin domain-containing protein 1 isoform X2 [Silurus meridionalis]